MPIWPSLNEHITSVSFLPASTLIHTRLPRLSQSTKDSFMSIAPLDSTWLDTWNKRGALIRYLVHSLRVCMKHLQLFPSESSIYADILELGGLSDGRGGRRMVGRGTRHGEPGEHDEEQSRHVFINYE